MFKFKVFPSIEGQQLASLLYVGDFIQLPAIENFVYVITAIDKDKDEVSVQPVGTLSDGRMQELPNSVCRFKFSGSTYVRHVVVCVFWSPESDPKS